MKYLHVFNSETDYNTVRESNYKEPWVSATNMGVGDSTPSYRVDYNINPKEIPLTFEITSAGNIVWLTYDSEYTVTLEYSKNGGEWTPITSSEEGASISVSAGDAVQFRCGTDSGYDTMSGNNVFEETTCGFNLSGNIMSLLNKNFASLNTLQSDDTFSDLFYGCTGLTDASKLVLPATTLSEGCYYDMFCDCTSLTKAPELPATTLADSCYNDMFNNTNVLPDCSNIDFTSATVVASGGLKGLFSGTEVTDNDLRQILPINPSTNNYYLPATTLAQSCYKGMFYGCTSLTTAPELPATTLADNCYQGMFYGCDNLTTAPALPATTLANYCYYEMFYGCISLTAAPELPATTLADSCYRSMFYGCSSLTTAPALPATTLAEGCYYYMFARTSLTTAPELPATTLADACYGAMFAGCTSLTTAPELPVTTLTYSCYSSMFSGCTSLTTAPELPATTLAISCYRYMFQGCTGLTTAPELPATTLAISCYYAMFQGCTSLTTAPALPATTLADESIQCYEQMFNGCSSLNYIKAMFTTTPGSSFTNNWVSGVAASGTFVKNSAATWNVTGTSGIPTGWTVQTV